MKNDPEVTTLMLQHRKLSTTRSMMDILFAWLQIASLIAIYLWAPYWWALVIIFFLVGARQYGLLVLLHDAQHSLLTPDHKTNDKIATWLLAAPFGVIFSKSRLVHIKHHQYLGTGEDDPDYPIYCTGKPEPKLTRRQVITYFLRQIFGAKFMRVFFPPRQEATKSTKSTELFAVLICQSIIFFLFVYTGLWLAYFYLWLLPLMTVATFLNEARIFCEHSNPLDKPDGLLISYISTPIERFFFGPFHMNYHAEHHFFPFIPHYVLPKVRKILQGLPHYQSQIQWRKGYGLHLLAYLKSVSQRHKNNESSLHSTKTI